ncbi:MAG TPA: GNAT family N-acetyltransferase [Candidatus Baltobacteraceae bacterium]|nr:GNAT family N-acetyltransferase [Candidatus Baltobacteraceae bacterium]
MQPSIREALAGDAPRIAQLCVQLGYDVPLAHVEWFLGLARTDRELLVAVVPRVGVVGWIGVAARPALLASARADVEGLIVEDEYRGLGIGARLLEAAEEWARKRGCTSVRVLSNVIRERAHHFYERRGFELRKSEHVFTKQL